MTGTPAGCPSSASRSGTAAGTCTTTWWWRCSTTCSASSPEAAAPVPGPYGHRLLGIDLATSHRFEREVLLGLRGHQAGLGPGQLQLLHQRDRVPVHPRCRGAGRDRRLAPAAPVSVRCSHGPVAPRRWRSRQPPLSLEDIRYAAWRDALRRAPDDPARVGARPAPRGCASAPRVAADPGRTDRRRPATWAWTSSSTTCAGS